MIQLLTDDKKVIYEQQQSEMFPDYCSVLREAIAYGISLEGLCVKSENIDNVYWRGTNLKSVSFRNCSMKRNTFLDCTGILHCYECNLDQSKFKDSKFKDIYISNSVLSKLSFRNALSEQSFLVDCDLTNSIFWESRLKNTTFHTCTLPHTLFYRCTLESLNLLHKTISSDWYENAAFIECDNLSGNMTSIKNLSELYFWETNLSEINFAKDEPITIIENRRSKAVLAIDSDVIWWKTHNRIEILPFRNSVKEFLEEVGNNFPSTDIYLDMDDFDVKEEMLAVCAYIHYLKK